MKIIDSRSLSPDPPAPELVTILDTISETQLREWVERIAVPRHFIAEPEQNRATADWLSGLFGELGYNVERQGADANILATPSVPFQDVILVGAHYDSVPKSPGADDNGSAVAAMLGCAAACRKWASALPVVFVTFNREEDDLHGSRNFVASYLPTTRFRVRCAHILEMVGYASTVPGSQRVPTGLPIALSPVGDFLGLLANRQSGQEMELVLHSATSYVPQLTATGLEVELGFEKVFPVLARSDHVPFWQQAIPAVMWTDTAEFRNRHYHQVTDTPDTLDYRFLRQVTQVLTAAVIAQASRAP